MTRIVTRLEGAGEALAALSGAKDKIREGWAEASFKVGATQVRRIRREFRTTRSSTSTGVQTGALRRSYAHEVKRTAQGVELSIGAIKPTQKGRVPLHARVHEGFDASGNRVSKFIIKSKKPGGFLVFPIRAGDGIGVAGITGWVRTKGPIKLRPRPSLDAVARDAPKEIQDRAARIFQQAIAR